MKNDREQSLNLITNALRSEVKLKLYAERKDGGEHELLTHFHKKPHYCLLKSFKIQRKHTKSLTSVVDEKLITASVLSLSFPFFVTTTRDRFSQLLYLLLHLSR